MPRSCVRAIPRRLVVSPSGSTWIIEHSGVTLDGLDFLQRAIATWRHVLVQWGLL